MTIAHKAEMPSGGNFTIEDPMPLGSAQMFMRLSDAILAGKPEAEYGMPVLDPTAFPAAIALDKVNRVVGDISDEYVLAGEGVKGGITYRCPSADGDESECITRTAKASALKIPQSVKLATTSKARDHRPLWSEREHAIVNFRFTDGHRDYARGLDLALIFQITGRKLHKHNLGIHYTMYRQQDMQDRLIDLGVYVEDPELGYRTEMYSQCLTETEEESVLRLFAEIGGHALQERVSLEP